MSQGFLQPGEASSTTEHRRKQPAPHRHAVEMMGGEDRRDTTGQQPGLCEDEQSRSHAHHAQTCEKGKSGPRPANQARIQRSCHGLGSHRGVRDGLPSEALAEHPVISFAHFQVTDNFSGSLLK